MRRGKIKKRWLLVALICGAQLLCMLLGVVWLTELVEQKLTAEMQPVLLQDAAIERVLSATRNASLSIVLAVVVLGTLMTLAIVQRYENRLAQVNEGLESQVAQRTEALVRARDAIIFGLAKLAESRDDDTGEHLERIRRYVALLAHDLAPRFPELTDQYIHRLEVASSLHDIGKVGVPDAVLLKPGSLTPDERAIIQTHPLVGGDCLLAIKHRLGDDPFIETACEVALAHHERWDGDGYPFGLRGDNIPLSARIVALADTYDALVSKRVYKEAMSHEQACDLILAEDGTHFDPEIVEAFRNTINDFRVVGQQYRQPEIHNPIPAPVPAVQLLDA